MMNEQVACPTASLSSVTGCVAQRLSTCFHREFDIVPRTELRRYLLALSHCGASWLAYHDWERIERSLVARTDDDQYMMIVPVTDSLVVDRRLRHLLPVDCLVATSSEPFPIHSNQLADTIVEAEQLRSGGRMVEQKLEHSLFQITTSFEELTWLRSLAEHFEICSLDDGLARAAQATLPDLRQLIYAQELLLLGIVSDESGSRAAPPILARDGEGCLTDQAICDLFLRLTAIPPGENDDALIVWNAPIHADQQPAAQAVRNCILVPVTKAEELHGWLLAINKAMPCEVMLQDEFALRDQNLIEFGTSEAGLMSTMAVMLATHTKNVNLLREKQELLLGVLRALVSTIDAKDAYTGGHSDRVAAYSKSIAGQLGLPPATCEEIYMSGLLHDIGKIGVPDAVLGKPERLTDDEFEQIKRHPLIGYEILKSLKPFAYLLDGVLHHHEAFDGSGYPHGLAGHDIPLMGRIIAVADTYDAMTSNRTYRQGMPVEKAISILKGGRGKQWDPNIVDAFLETH